MTTKNQGIDAQKFIESALNNDGSWKEVYSLNPSNLKEKVQILFKILNYFEPNNYYIEAGDQAKTLLENIGITSTFNGISNIDPMNEQDVKDPLLVGLRCNGFIFYIRSKKDSKKFIKFVPNLFDYLK